MAVTEAGTRVKEAAAGSAIVRPWRPPSTGIAATGYGFVEVLMASPTLIATGKSGDWSSAAGRKLPATGGAMLCCVLYMHQCNAFMLCLLPLLVSASVCQGLGMYISELFQLVTLIA